ncbi:MAG: DNA translocase FtsK, partial [Planctomycetota bacterium]
EQFVTLARAGVRHLTSYNQLTEEERLERLQPANDAERKAIPDYLPFIVIVADEMADLMMTAGKEVEAHIIRLAQKSRAVGIHLILATQKPTVDVITGLIKSNLPARIAFQVASKTDSRVVLDAMGADKLLGMGDMLFLQPGTSSLLRGQGTYLSDPEIDAITGSCSTGEQTFVSELVNLKISDDKEEESGKQVDNSRDDLYEKAVDVIVREQRGSVSLLQRNLGIGYGRSARLIDYMAEDGIVGPYNGSKAREVLIGPGQWEAMKAGGGSSGQSDDDAVETVVSESSSSAAVEPAVAVKRSKPKKTLLKREAEEAATAGSHLAASSAPVVEAIDEVMADEELEEDDDVADEGFESLDGSMDENEHGIEDEEEYDEYEEDGDVAVASAEAEGDVVDGEYEDVEDEGPAEGEEYEDVDEEYEEEYEDAEYEDDDDYEYEDAEDYEDVE